MPMATPELAAKFEDDGDAWSVLTTLGWTMTKGFRLVPPPGKTFPLTGQEADALDYLVDEWDYAF